MPRLISDVVIYRLNTAHTMIQQHYPFNINAPKLHGAVLNGILRRQHIYGVIKLIGKSYVVELTYGLHSAIMLVPSWNAMLRDIAQFCMVHFSDGPNVVVVDSDLVPDYSSK